MSGKGINLATARQMLADARDRGDWDGVRTLAAMIADEQNPGPDAQQKVQAIAQILGAEATDSDALQAAFEALIAEAAGGGVIDPQLEAMNREEHLGLTASELATCSRHNCDPRRFARMRLGS